LVVTVIEGPTQNGHEPGVVLPPGIDPGIPGLEPDAPEADAGTLTALDIAHDFIRRYIALTDVQADIVALWAASTWCQEAFDVTPYISVQSVEPGAGKTSLMEVCEQIVAAPWLTARCTAAALVRKIAADKPTLLLDETDSVFHGNAQSQQVLRGALNAGYKRSGKVAYAQGGSYVDIPVFCPKMFAGLSNNDLPATVKDRSIPILMRKRTAFDRTERIRRRDVAAAAEVPRMLLLRFGVRHLEALARARPEIPPELDDRAADVCEPLLAIADCAGGTWPVRARLAVVELMKERKASNTQGSAFRLLATLHGLFAELGTDRLKTETVLEMLAVSEAVEEAWPSDAASLAATLRGFAVYPRKIRLGKTTAQGYVASEVGRAYESLAADLVPPVPGVPGVPGDEVVE
jgi:hypothetical protein